MERHYQKFFIVFLENSNSSPYTEKIRQNAKTVPTSSQCYRLMPQIGNPNMYPELETSGIPIICVRKIFVSKQKQRHRDLQIKLSALHQQHHLDLKSLKIVFKNNPKLKTLTKNTHWKKNGPSRKKRRKKQCSR